MERPTRNEKLNAKRKGFEKYLEEIGRMKISAGKEIKKNQYRCNGDQANKFEGAYNWRRHLDKEEEKAKKKLQDIENDKDFYEIEEEAGEERDDGWSENDEEEQREFSLEEEQEAIEEGWDRASQKYTWEKETEEESKLIGNMQKRVDLQVIEDLASVGLTMGDLIEVSKEYDQILEEEAKKGI